MFSAWGESSGLFGLLAPLPKEALASNKHNQRKKKNNPKEDQSSPCSSSTVMVTSLLQNQQEREIKATASNGFAKYQRALYFDKARSLQRECCVVGVHSEKDSADDLPYYTIQYHCLEQEQNNMRLVEKQTTRDRLQYVKWDEKMTLSWLKRFNKQL